MSAAFSRSVQSLLLHILLALLRRLVPPRHVVQLANRLLLRRHVLPRRVVQWASRLQQLTTQLVPAEIIVTWNVPRGRVLYRPREEQPMLLRKVKCVLVQPVQMAVQLRLRESLRDRPPLQGGDLRR